MDCKGTFNFLSPAFTDNTGHLENIKKFYLERMSQFYSRHCQIFMRELFAKIFNRQKLYYFHKKRQRCKSNYNNSRITQVLLYGDTSFKNETNTNISKNTISYLLVTKRFDKPIFED